MALFLRGKYMGYYKAGGSKCVRDIFRFNKSAEDKISLEVTRRDMTALAKRFWKLETNKFTLHPINEDDPRQGGKVTVRALTLDVRTLIPQMKTLYGIYGDDFIQYGEFAENLDPLNDEELLLKITESIEGSDEIIKKTTFRFANDNLSYEHLVNENLLDKDLHFQINETPLMWSSKTSWSEKLFYGIGNKNM